jgi:hypothetical protein
MIKVGVKVKDDKYLGMERVIVKPKSSMNKPKLLYSQFQYSIIFNMMLISLESDKQISSKKWSTWFLYSYCTQNIVKRHQWFHTSTKVKKKPHDPHRLLL